MWKLNSGDRPDQTSVISDDPDQPYFVLECCIRRPGSALSQADIEWARSIRDFLNGARSRPGCMSELIRLDETTATIGGVVDLRVEGPLQQLDGFAAADKRARLMDYLTLL